MSGLMLLAALSAGAADEQVRWDFAAGDGGLAPGGEIGTTWQWGVVDSGPGAGLDGASAWGTVLAGDYLNDAVETLTLPPLALAGLTEPSLGLTHWYAIDAAGVGDLGRVEARIDGTWELLEPVYGYPVAGGFQGQSGEWTTSWFDLTGLGDDLDVRLVLESDLAVVDDGWYLGAAVVVDGDAVAPRITLLTRPRDTQDLESGERITAEIVDDRGGVSGHIAWSDDRGGAGIEGLLPQGDDVWSALVPAREPDTRVTWQVVASDGSNAARSSEDSYRTFLAPPDGLEGPDGPVAATTVALSWTPPDAPYPVLSYVVLREDEVVAETPDTSVDAPLVDGSPRFSVLAVFDTPLGDREGDASARVAIDAAVPVLEPPVPASAWAGDRVRLRLQGQHLLLADGQVDLDLGDGVAVLDLDVRDVTTLVAEVEFDLDADTGPRDLTLHTPTESLTLSGAFRVREAADRPRVVALTPDHLTRGERATVAIQTRGGLATGAPAVWLGAGVVVESVTVAGDRVTVVAAAAEDAPLGDHPVEIDDGLRVLDGPTLEVRRPAAAVQRSCGVGPGAGGLALWLALLGGLGRQRARRGPASSVKSRSSQA